MQATLLAFPQTQQLLHHLPYPSPPPQQLLQRRIMNKAGTTFSLQLLWYIVVVVFHRFQDRPDNLFTNFISWRGLLTKLLCTPYNKTEPWKMAATLYNGTIYLREIQTIEGKEREANMSQREKELCYWGLKFEDYMTSKGKLMTSCGLPYFLFPYLSLSL